MCFLAHFKVKNYLLSGYIIKYQTLVESSSILVCSAMKRTQKHVLCTSGGHEEWLKPGGGSGTGLSVSSSAPTPSRPANPAPAPPSLDPCTRQLPPNLLLSPILKISLQFKENQTSKSLQQVGCTASFIYVFYTTAQITWTSVHQVCR